MAVKYKIEQLRGLTVRIHQPRAHLGDITVWAPVWQEISELQAVEITAYVELHELGRRTAYDMWQLKNPQTMTLFMLHYG
jgi:hypothetical protein